jgi:hypothetical protein
LVSVQLVESADFALNMVEIVKDPETFDDAYNNPEPEEKMMWRSSISKEFEEMKAKGVGKNLRSRRFKTVASALRTSGYSQLNETELTKPAR